MRHRRSGISGARDGEEALAGSGVSHAIVRPALVFGLGDVLVNNTPGCSAECR
jgi:hypothetical protein